MDSGFGARSRNDNLAIVRNNSETRGLQTNIHSRLRTMRSLALLVVVHSKRALPLPNLFAAIRHRLGHHIRARVGGNWSLLPAQERLSHHGHCSYIARLPARFSHSKLHHRLAAASHQRLAKGSIHLQSHCARVHRCLFPLLHREVRRVR